MVSSSPCSYVSRCWRSLGLAVRGALNGRFPQLHRCQRRLISAPRPRPPRSLARATWSVRCATRSRCERNTTTRCSQAEISRGLLMMPLRAPPSPRGHGASRCSGLMARFTATWSQPRTSYPPTLAASQVTTPVCGASGHAAIDRRMESGGVGPIVALRATAGLHWLPRGRATRRRCSRR